MIKRTITSAIMAIVVAMAMVSCMSVNMGMGDKDETPTQVPELNKLTTMHAFEEVEIGGPFKVLYEQGEAYSVRIEGPEEALKEMTVYVKEGDLCIRKAVNHASELLKNVKVYVTSPVIKSIEIAGSGLFTASDPLTAADLQTEIAGSGKIMLVQVDCSNASMEISGSGGIEIGQLQCATAKAEIAGSGDINLSAMKCKMFKIEVAGSGNVNCESIDVDEVDTEIAGSGDVNLKGTVRFHTDDIAGSGKVNINRE